MKKILNIVISVLIYMWLLPQNIVGLIVFIYYRPKKLKKQGFVTYYNFSSPLGSISLGKYIFLCDSHWGDDLVEKHEYGHFIQGLYLSWFYLLVIGLPSLIWAGVFAEYRLAKNVSYYSFYTEKWADYLSKIKR
jgi:hypothetical protein